jgi:hypothetical protein
VCGWVLAPPAVPTQTLFHSQLRNKEAGLEEITFGRVGFNSHLVYVRHLNKPSPILKKTTADNSTGVKSAQKG